MLSFRLILVDVFKQVRVLTCHFGTVEEVEVPFPFLLAVEEFVLVAFSLEI